MDMARPDIARRENRCAGIFTPAWGRSSSRSSPARFPPPNRLQLPPCRSLHRVDGQHRKARSHVLREVRGIGTLVPENVWVASSGY